MKIDWAYDAESRLVGETRDVGNDGQDGEDYVATYAYDLAGNRLSKVLDSATNNLDETITYAYNDRDEVTAEDSSLSGNDVSYTYDANGSTLTQTKGTQAPVKYVWDLRNRMVGLDSNGDGDTHDAGDAEYAYDSAGVRASKTLDPTQETESQTLYVVDDANPTGYAKPIEEKASPTATPTRGYYILGLDVIGQADGTSAPVYLLADGHGTTRALLSAAGAVTATYDYDAFGEAIGFNANSAATGFQSADGYHDAESGLDYNLARYRRGPVFLSMDPAPGSSQDPVSVHRYLYAGADSINRVDPSGRVFFGVLGLLGATIAGAGTGLCDVGQACGVASFAAAVVGAADLYYAKLDMLILSMSGTPVDSDEWDYAGDVANTGNDLIDRAAKLGALGADLMAIGSRMQLIGGAIAIVGAIGGVATAYSFGIGAARASVSAAPFPRRGGMNGVRQSTVKSQVPSSWAKGRAKGSGWVARDEAGRERIRFMRPDPSGRFAHQRTGYWRFNDANGNFLDEFGNIVPTSDPCFIEKTHIMYTGLD